MPYKYIGRTHDFKGKSLWEILGNLKNLGVGRIVARSRMERYPEPTYMKILRVESLPAPENETPDNSRLVRVLVEKTFRGNKLPKPVLIESASYKTDYRLIPKDQEESYCKNVPKSDAVKRILPRRMELPPLLKELVWRDIQTQSDYTEQDLEIDIAYNKKGLKPNYRIAEEGEQPTEKISVGLGKPVTDRLYKGIDL